MIKEMNQILQVIHALIFYASINLNVFDSDGLCLGKSLLLSTYNYCYNFSACDCK